MIFMINGQDYSNRVVSGKYKINRKPQTIDWTDGNGRTHKVLQCYKIYGTLDMFFRNIDEFNAFAVWVNSSKNDNLANEIRLTVNNAAEDVDIEGFVDFEPIRARDDLWQDYMLQYSVSIQER